MTLTDLQSRLKAIVETAELLANRPVLIEEKGNLVSQLDVVLQTQSLAVVIALASGSAKGGGLKGRTAWDETFEVVIHRGLLDGESVPATLAVLDQLRTKIQGAAVDATDRLAGSFSCSRHDLREGGDGTYARVLNVTVENVPAALPPAP